MAKHLLVVMTNPVSKEREAEFNQWYNNQHVPDVLKLPGFVAATRYVAPATGAPPPTWKYLAVYEVEADDPAKVMATLGEAAGDPTKMRMSDTLDPSGFYMSLYTPMGQRVAK